MRERLRIYMGQLAELSGEIKRYDANLGRWFKPGAGEELFHVTRGVAQKPGENNPRVAKVVEIELGLLTHEDGTPVNLLSRADMMAWLRKNLQGKTVQIADDGSIVKFIREPLNASLKRRGIDHSQMYANLANILKNAIFDKFEEADERHKGKVKGQNVYYAAIKINNTYYALKIKIDIPEGLGWKAYKDHKVSEIEIAPSLYRDSRVAPNAAQTKSAITGISLAILKGDVKPSRIENDVLYQFAGEKGMQKADQASGHAKNMANLYIAKKMEARGRDAKAVKLATGWERGADGKWRYEIADPVIKKDASILVLDAERSPDGDAVFSGRLAEIADAPELFEAYPELADMPVYFEALPDNELGYYKNSAIILSNKFIEGGEVLEMPEAERLKEIENSAEFDRLVKGAREAARSGDNDLADALRDEWLATPLGREWDRLDEEFGGMSRIRLDLSREARKTLVHEIQHAIQERVGFARGASPEDGGFDEYWKAAGEVEARNVETRLGLNPEEKSGKPAYETEDVERENQLFYDHGDMSMSSQKEVFEDGKPVEVSSSELGIPYEADLQEFIDVAKKYHDQLKFESEHGNPVFVEKQEKPVRFSRRGWQKNVYGGASRKKWMLFPKLREIISTAKWKYTNEITDKPGFTKAHWYENQVNLDGESLTVGFTLLEDKAGNLFYNIANDIRRTSKGKLSNGLPVTQRQGPEELHQDELTSNDQYIHTNKDNVNLEIIETPLHQKKRGSVQLFSDTYLVSLFEDADLSTLLHETGHIFFEELRKIVQTGHADEALAKDYRIIRDWLGALDDEELALEQREKAARGFEAYLMEGRAPSRELKGAFSRFRKWLLSIYRKAANLDVDLTDEVRGVFDRMLASEAEIAQAAQGSGLDGLSRQELEKLGLDSAEMLQLEKAPISAREKAAEALQAEREKNRKSRMAA